MRMDKNKMLKELNVLLLDAFKKFDDKPDQFYKCYMDGVTDALDMVMRCEDDAPNEPEEKGLLFYEPLSGRYFTMTLDAFDQALKKVRKIANAGDVMTVNDWFECLGLEPQMVFGYAYFWETIPDPFVSTSTDIRNGKPVWTIYYTEKPTNKSIIA